MPRTSLSHPLYVDCLSVGPGRVGLTICSGKKGDSIYGAAWDRDLGTDLDAIRVWGADAVVTLLEAEELAALDVASLGDEVRRKGMDWYHLAVRDLEAPDAEQLGGWRHVSPMLHRVLDRGGRVLLHCRGGIGRSGTMAALLLIERGDTAETAIARIREARPHAVETGAQTRFLKDRAAATDREQRIQASLFGGAMGDALGAEIEFWSLASIRAAYPDGLADIPAHDGRVGSITDDTQMTLFTAEGLIHAAVQSAAGGGVDDAVSAVHRALLRWYVTQGGRPRPTVDETGLVRDPRLHRRRSPGLTVMDALRRSNAFGQSAVNDSKSCGTIMRVAPVAFCRNEGIARLARETSALTHGHTTGQEAAAAWALVLASVHSGASVEDAARDQVGRFGNETDAALTAAMAIRRDGQPETVETLGGGWIAEEALAIALYAALASTGVEEGLRIAVTHSGDSDSTGAIAGNLLGLLYPDATMAHRWRREIECGDVIDRLGRELVACHTGR